MKTLKNIIDQIQLIEIILNQRNNNIEAYGVFFKILKIEPKIQFPKSRNKQLKFLM